MERNEFHTLMMELWTWLLNLIFLLLFSFSPPNNWFISVNLTPDSIRWSLGSWGNLESFCLEDFCDRTSEDSSVTQSRRRTGARKKFFNHANNLYNLYHGQNRGGTHPVKIFLLHEASWLTIAWYISYKQNVNAAQWPLGGEIKIRNNFSISGWWKAFVSAKFSFKSLY